MDIEQYLQTGRGTSIPATSRIRNFEVFDFNYVRRSRSCAKRSSRSLILLRYQQTGIANNVLILGPGIG